MTVGVATCSSAALMANAKPWRVGSARTSTLLYGDTPAAAFAVIACLYVSYLCTASGAYTPCRGLGRAPAACARQPSQTTSVRQLQSPGIRLKLRRTTSSNWSDGWEGTGLDVITTVSWFFSCCISSIAILPGSRGWSGSSYWYEYK